MYGKGDKKPICFGVSAFNKGSTGYKVSLHYFDNMVLDGREDVYKDYMFGGCKKLNQDIKRRIIGNDYNPKIYG